MMALKKGQKFRTAISLYISSKKTLQTEKHFGAVGYKTLDKVQQFLRVFIKAILILDEISKPGIPTTGITLL